MTKASYGGAQGKAGNASRVKHGFPRVPQDVGEPKQLRRYLQATRDGLNEWRWLFDGLSGLTSVQQARLVQLLVTLAQQNNTINNQAATITQLQLDLQNLQTQHTLDEQANAQAHTQFATDIGQVQQDYAQLQADYNTLLGRVNCLNVAAGGVCP